MQVIRDEFRQAEELRTNLQTSALRRKLVDFKMNCVPLYRQVDDPAAPGETLGFAHRQNA
jgi:hypothetical protein